MNVLLAMLIVAAVDAAPTDRHYPDAVPVYACPFEPADDADFDGWPDGWSRRRDLGFPHYLPIELRSDGPDQGKSYLKMTLNGGAAAVFSSNIKIQPLASYVLEVMVKTEGLHLDHAFLSIAFLDARDIPLETVFSVPAFNNSGWTRLRLGPISPKSAKAQTAIIGLHLEPPVIDSGDGDLTGSASFDDVWLGELPHMTLAVDDPQPLYPLDKTILLAGVITGSQQPPAAVIELYTALGQPVPADEGTAHTTRQEPRDQPGRWSQTWKTRFTAPGLYRVRMKWIGASGFAHTDEVPLPLVEPWPRVTGGEFGWTLPKIDNAKIRSDLLRLLDEAGVSWVKTPLWIDPDDKPGVEHAVTLCEELRQRDKQLIGVLGDPPLSARKAMKLPLDATATRIFATEPSGWMPSLEPLLTRFGLQVCFWQLGSDHDLSLATDPDAVAKVARVQKQFTAISSGFRLGIPWRTDMPLVNAKKLPWRYLSLTTPAGQDPDSFIPYLNAQKKSPAELWVMLDPPAQEGQSSVERATALVQQMLQAKIHGARGIGYSDLVSHERGLLENDGTPGELYLPWRTAAWALSGSEYLGSTRLPHKSENHVFVRGDQAVVVAWNSKPTREIYYLGPDAQKVDLWGKSSKLVEVKGGQLLELGPVPTFFCAGSAAVARWREAMNLEKTRFDSVFGITQPDQITIKNTFGAPVFGNVHVIVPDGWQARPKLLPIKLAAGEVVKLPLDFFIPLNGTTGRQLLRFDVELTGQAGHQFSVYRRIDVGNDDQRIEITTEIDRQGNLAIRQRLINETDQPVSFRCNLYAPGLRRIRWQVMDLGRGDDIHTYLIPDGSQYLGHMLWVARKKSAARVC